jgi:peptidoglycan/LPS O-acetylase OafA/YrhL
VASNYSNNYTTVSDCISPIGKYGVLLFFLLSSFLLTSLLVRALTRGPFTKVLSTYALRRVFRIYPMFLVTIACLALFPAFRDMMFAKQEFSYIDQIFLLNAGGIFWAVGVEFEFYLLLPLIPIAFVLTKHPLARLGIIAATTVVIILVWVASRTYFQFPPNYPHLAPYLHLFLGGVALALTNIMIQDGDMPVPPKNLALAFLWVGLAGSLYVVPAIGKNFVSPILGTEALFHFLASPEGVTASWALVLVGILHGGAAVQRAFALPWLRFIGVISYSIYLMHIFTLSQIMPWQNYLGIGGALATSVLATILLASATYVGIERPFMRLRF